MPILTFTEMMVLHLFSWQASLDIYTDLVTFLLKANANPNLHRDDGATPIFKTSQKGHADIVNLLLRANANSNLHSDDGTTSLMIACSYKHHELFVCCWQVKLTQINWTLLVYLLLCLPVMVVNIVDLIHAVELSQSSSISPVLTASEIAVYVDNETLNTLNGAMEKMLVDKAETFPIHSRKHEKILPSRYEQHSKIV